MMRHVLGITSINNEGTSPTPYSLLIVELFVQSFIIMLRV